MISAKQLRESPEVRDATLALLDISERAVRFVQRANEQALTHLRLRLRAWQLALDPATKEWIAEAKGSVSDGTAQKGSIGSNDARRLLEEHRRRLP